MHLKNILKEYYLKLVTSEAKMKRGKVTDLVLFYWYRDFKKQPTWAGGMAQLLHAHVTHSENQGLVPSTHMGIHKHSLLQFPGGLNMPSWPPQAPDMHRCTYICEESIHIHKISKSRKRAMSMQYSILLTDIKNKAYWQWLDSSFPVESWLFCPTFALLVFQTHMVSVV